MTTDVPALFERHYLPLVRLAMRLVDDQDSAEDLVQDVFAAAGSRLTRMDDPGRYLQKAVVNRARSVLRHRRVVRGFWSRADREDFSEGADESSLRSAERGQMLAEIAALPTRQKQVVVLRYYEDLSVGEIARLLSISAGSVSTALNRALTALAATIGEDRD